MARELSKNPTVLIVNDSVFAHGGLLPGHVKYGLARLNGEVAAWMRGDCLPDGSRTAPPFLAMGCVLTACPLQPGRKLQGQGSRSHPLQHAEL